MRKLSLLLFLFALGCNNKAEDDTDTDTDTDTDADIIPVELANLTWTEEECEGGDDAPSVLTSVTGEGVVQVLHNVHETSACLGFEAIAGLVLSTDGLFDGYVTVAYTEVGEPCDCISDYTVGYELKGLPSGSFSLGIPDDLADVVTIP
jgi:hypothetical protein